MKKNRAPAKAPGFFICCRALGSRPAAAALASYTPFLYFSSFRSISRNCLVSWSDRMMEPAGIHVLAGTVVRMTTDPTPTQTDSSRTES